MKRDTYKVTVTVDGKQLAPVYPPGEDALSAIAAANYQLYGYLTGKKQLSIEAVLANAPRRER